jgi:twinkle protein
MEYRDKLNELGITLKKSGKQTCPKCSQTRKNKDDKCLSVTYGDEAVLYNCHHCGWSGAVYYRSKYELKKDFKKPQEPKIAKDLTPVQKYFEKRGISPKTLDKYKVTCNDKKQIIFPYYKNGELVNVKLRTNLGNGKKTFTQSPDSEKTLFGMDVIQDYEKPLIWVEGECDVLALAEQGIYSVSIPQGASENKLECIENCFEFIQQFKQHIIAVDNDKQGDKLKLNLLSRLGRENCKIVNWKQYKDANEALMAGEQLKDFIEKADFINPDGIINFFDETDAIYKYNYEIDKDYYSTGWKDLDNIIKIRTGYLMIVTGYPSRGKSTFVDNLLINLSRNYGLKHLIASFESIPASHFNSLIEMYLQKPIYAIRQEEQIFGDGFEFIANHFYRFDVNRTWTIDEIAERAELAVRKYGINTLVIDPYNRLKNDYNDREDKYIGSILSKLSMLSKKLNILIIFVAHPKKPDGEAMPNMYSISGSGDWYNMADYGIIVHRERGEDKKLKNTPEICVAKIKNFSLGNPSGGSITLNYNKDKRILEDISVF